MGPLGLFHETGGFMDPFYALALVVGVHQAFALN
jgi:hypothetical protein